ncbi:MAG: PqqD family protein [Chloroflexi bacterium]|nr:PqqD family protein [Chloroflexota bacterium]
MPTRIPLHQPDTASRLFDDEAVIIAPRANRVHMLNPEASRIWALADGSHTVADIAQILTQEFDVTADHALQSASNFLQALADKNLIVWVSSPKQA